MSNFGCIPFPGTHEIGKLYFKGFFVSSHSFSRRLKSIVYICAPFCLYFLPLEMFDMLEKNHVLFEVGLHNLYVFSKTSSPPLFLPSLQVWVIMELWSIRVMEETWSNSSTYRPSPRLGHYGNRPSLEMLICLKTLMCSSKYVFKMHEMAKAWWSS